MSRERPFGALFDFREELVFGVHDDPCDLSARDVEFLGELIVCPAVDQVSFEYRPVSLVLDPASDFLAQSVVRNVCEVIPPLHLRFLTAARWETARGVVLRGPDVVAARCCFTTPVPRQMLHCRYPALFELPSLRTRTRVVVVTLCLAVEITSDEGIVA